MPISPYAAGLQMAETLKAVVTLPEKSAVYIPDTSESRTLENVELWLKWDRSAAESHLLQIEIRSELGMFNALNALLSNCGPVVLSLKDDAKSLGRRLEPVTTWQGISTTELPLNVLIDDCHLGSVVAQISFCVDSATKIEEIWEARKPQQT